MQPDEQPTDQPSPNRRTNKPVRKTLRTSLRTYRNMFAGDKLGTYCDMFPARRRMLPTRAVLSLVEGRSFRKSDQPTCNRTRNRRTDGSNRHVPIRFGARCPTLRAKTGTTISARRAAFRLGQVPRKRHTRQGASDGCADGDDYHEFRIIRKSASKPRFAGLRRQEFLIII